MLNIPLPKYSLCGGVGEGTGVGEGLGEGLGEGVGSGSKDSNVLEYISTLGFGLSVIGLMGEEQDIRSKTKNKITPFIENPLIET
jgi:hypothetical protein